MDRETQNVEFKQSWHDEYLEWICGYANAFGGTLYIGRADDGTPVGVAKSKSLMETIPCKITDTMGIVADVNLRIEDGKDVIEIVVEKYPSLISYHGKYYYRSGSTMRTITGKELDKLILRQHGRTWDAVPMPKIKSTQLDAAAIAYFKEEAVRRNRLTPREVRVSREVLLENLRLVDEDGYLVRAAMMAFHKDPEKWITGAYVKIGCFGENDADLLYQDEVHGPLVMQADKVVDLVYTKYLKALITYNGIHRVEQFMFHPDAFREIVLNAIVHKDYASCNPIQISVYPDKIYIWNDGTFPEELNTAAKLYRKHSSKPFNPLLANTFFKCGLIEAWGRGFEKIVEGCREYAGPRPSYKISANGVMVLCKACQAYEKLRSDETINEGINETISETINETISETISETIKSNPGIGLVRLSGLSGKSRATVARAVAALVKEGRVEYRGSKKTGGYYAIGSGEGKAVLMDSETINDGISDGLNEGINEGINERVLRLVKSHPGKRLPFFKTQIDKSTATLERTFISLIAANKVEYRGSKKTGGYYPVENI